MPVLGPAKACRSCHRCRSKCMHAEQLSGMIERFLMQRAIMAIRLAAFDAEI